MKAKHKSLLVFGLAAFLGALIWLLSPLLAGHREPWDAQSHYYVCALLVAGFLPACLSAERFYLSALGVWLGQTVTVVSLIVLSDGPSNGLWLIGLIFLLFYSLWALAGALLGMYVRLALRWLRSHASKVV